MSHDTAPHHPPGMPEHHIDSDRVYYVIYFSLLAFLAVGVAIAYFDLGILNLIITFSIAAVKACLILLYFMHARYNPKIFFLSVGMAIFLMLTAVILFSDVLARTV